MTICLAYMVSTRRWDLTKAYTLLKTLRPRVKPKANFLRQLIRFQQGLLTSERQERAAEQEPAQVEAQEAEEAVQEPKSEKVAKKRKLERRRDGDGGEEEEEEKVAQPPHKKARRSKEESPATKCKDTIESKSLVFGMALPPPENLISQT